VNKNLLINGTLIKTKEKQKVINPSNGEVITEVSVASQKDIESALKGARQAFDKGEWREISFEERKKIILKIAEGILEHAGEFARLETLNTGKPIKESTFMDIPSAAKTFEYFAHNFEKFLKDESIDISAEAKSKLLRQPQGVVLLIVPWNYPLLIASWKMAQALAAGNTVILKPSSLTPLTALQLAGIIKEIGIPKGVINVINGQGGVLGKALCADKRVDMISFTGSNEVGRRVINYASKNVKKLIMELGGKSASIILKDADLEAAVNSSLCSIFLNQGQMCTAMSRIFVENDIYNAFVEDFVSKAKSIKLGRGQDYQTQMGPLISEAQRARVIKYVKKAKTEGAQLLCGGKIPSDESLKKGFFFEPTVFAGVKPKMQIFQEEVFGPVSCISRFHKIEEALDLANNTEFALAACIWTKDREKAQALASRINAGNIWINTYGMFYNEVPYGGFKQSGFGKELGKDGFLEYTRLKNIVIDTTKDLKPLVNYWYGF